MFSIISNIRIFKYLIFSILLSCGGGGDDSNPSPYPDPEVVIPTNLALSVIIVGTNTSNPNGDGTGVIQCTASATNTVKYEFRFGGGVVIESTTGNVSHTYTDKGNNNYTVTVIAYSKTGHSVSTFKNIAVYVKEDIFNILKFSDEFDIPGSPDNSKWNFDLGTGQGGWGNNESQYYTSRPDNVKVENGVLKIIAKKEAYQNSNYTSTRMKTQGKFDFKYGRVEVKAKLPFGKGTWPAIWMLGSNITTVGWPACGEIDIMEHAGNRQGIVQSAMHTPSSYGNTINVGSRTITDVSTEFHVYGLTWTSQEMIFTIDGIEHYRYNPSSKNSSTWPFYANQFLLLNVAMGGTFGGSIDPTFNQSTMEIDYVRVYQ